MRWSASPYAAMRRSTFFDRVKSTTSRYARFMAFSSRASTSSSVQLSERLFWTHS